MENNFDQIMSSKTTEELINIIQIDRDNYQLEAIKSAENEIYKRGVSVEDIENITKNIIEIKIKSIELEINSVSSGIRFINFFIDFLVWLTITFILTLPLNAHNNSHKLIGYLIMIISYFLYYSVFEIKYQKTLGKIVTRTKVVTYDEKIPNRKDIFIRTFSRFIPFDQISFFFSKNGLHDMLSKTKVIKTK